MRSNKTTRQVEYYRCWDDGTWDTDFIEIPIHTPEDQLEEAIRAAAFEINWQTDVPAFVGLYCATWEEDDLEDNDQNEDDNK